METNQTQTQPQDELRRRGRKSSAPRERMEACDASITPLEGGALREIVQTARANGVRLFRMRYVGPVRVVSAHAVTMLEAWIAATGVTPEQLAKACDVSPNTIRNQTFCPPIFELLSHETGIDRLVLAGNKKEREWVLCFDEEGKVTGSVTTLLDEATMQRLARSAGFVLPPKAA